MATAELKKIREFGPESSGTLMTPREFDRADFVEGWRYELIHGVLVASPIPSESERDPNEELGHLLRGYRDESAHGYFLDATLPEQTVRTRNNRRRIDRVIWAGLGRQPRRGEVPTIAVEFVSAGKRARRRDYEEKRDEFMEIGVGEYWVIDRFQRTLTVFFRQGGKIRTRVVQENKIYTTKRLPGFELHLAKLFVLADLWLESEEND